MVCSPPTLNDLTVDWLTESALARRFRSLSTQKSKKTESSFIGQTNSGQITVFYMHFWSLNWAQLSGIPKRLVGYSVIEQQFDCLYAGEGRLGADTIQP